MGQRMTLTDSSPFQSSPLEGVTSPRLFWQNRSFNSENSYSSSPTCARRESLERLQKASRVKNSNILALEQKNEYDPSKPPQIERPLAKIQHNVFGRNNGVTALQSTGNRPTGHQRSESKTTLPVLTKPAAPPASHSTSTTATTTNPTSSTNTAAKDPALRPMSPSKDQPSPLKSSLSSRFKNSYDSQGAAWSGDEHDLPPGRSLHRHQKSVTFDNAPPQINEYEMVTPDISSIDSNSREGSFCSDDDDEDDDYMYHHNGHFDPDDSFDASLEDTAKTPVVGPDDWRDDDHDDGDDEYERSPAPEDLKLPERPFHRRTDSGASNGEGRPLPPLPGAARSLPNPPAPSHADYHFGSFGNSKMPLEERLRLMMLSDDGKAAVEQQRERRMRRAANRDRSLSRTPETEGRSRSSSAQPQSDYDEDNVPDISGLGEYKLPPRISRESIMRRVNTNEQNKRQSDDSFSSPPAATSSDAARNSYPYDPDEPIPSTELEEDVDDSSSVIIKRDHDDKEYDGYHRPYERPPETLDDESDDDEKKPNGYNEVSDFSEDERATPDDNDKGKGKQLEEDHIVTPRAASPAPPESPAEEKPVTQGSALLANAPKLEPNVSFSQSIDSVISKHSSLFSNSVNSVLPKPDESQDMSEPEKRQSTTPDIEPPPHQRPFTPEQQLRASLSKPEYDGTGWGSPEEYEDEPGTPESVIHRPMPDSDDEEARASPAIPEQFATVKSAAGSKLKTRPSATPADLAAMREARRQVSGQIAPYEVPEVPDIPPIPERNVNRPSSTPLTNEEKELTGESFLERHPSFKNRSLTLDLDFGLSLDQDFERVIEAQKVAFEKFSLVPSATSPVLQSEQQKSAQYGSDLASSTTTDNIGANAFPRKQRGYLMRQNTKVVTASDKDTDDLRSARSAGNSPVKPLRPQSWTVEPWNSQARKRSLRKRTPATGPVPPLPGQESNAAGLSRSSEEDLAAEMMPEDGGERGRLFVKVMGVKDLDLPLPKSESNSLCSFKQRNGLTRVDERTWFSLTLDNGVHCVTTAWLELARNAPIGQEFELVVPNDLEFQLTLNVKLEKPKAPPAPAVLTKKSLPTPSKPSKPKTSTFSRVFASPKKRREMEARQKQQEEEERRLAAAREAQARQMKAAAAPTAWDLLSPLAGDDGAFARAYVCLKEHENKCFGRPYHVEVALFNEWAKEDAGFASSVKSKRSNNTLGSSGSGGVVRRAPYKIGKLELQMLFVPRPKGATDEDMPKSMNSCIREMKAAEERLARTWEGHLSQQGGDCPYWRRRYFKLVGTKLTAYHEATRQPRATINLANAKRLIDDRRTLLEKGTIDKNGKRRRSAFAEDEEGYMFVEEGFRIRFNNGEVIDFYADSTKEKEEWMRVLGEVIGRDSLLGDDDIGSSGGRMRGKWCELVLKREEMLRKRAQAREERRVHSRTKSMYI